MPPHAPIPVCFIHFKHPTCSYPSTSVCPQISQETLSQYVPSTALDAPYPCIWVDGLSLGKNPSIFMSTNRENVELIWALVMKWCGFKWSGCWYSSQVGSGSSNSKHQCLHDLNSWPNTISTNVNYLPFFLHYTFVPGSSILIFVLGQPFCKVPTWVILFW